VYLHGGSFPNGETLHGAGAEGAPTVSAAGPETRAGDGDTTSAAIVTSTAGEI